MKAQHEVLLRKNHIPKGTHNRRRSPKDAKALSQERKKNMKNHSIYWIIPIFFLGFLLMSGPVVNEAHAQKRHDRGVRSERYSGPPPGHRAVHGERHRYYEPRGNWQRKGPRGYERSKGPRRAVTSHLPRGHRVIHVGKDRYYEHRGIWYVRGSRGYYRVRAPRGAFISHLPPGHRRIVHERRVYYSYGGDHYRRAPGGYIVINLPLTIR